MASGNESGAALGRAVVRGIVLHVALAGVAVSLGTPVRALDLRIGGALNVNSAKLTTGDPDLSGAFKDYRRSGLGLVLELRLAGSLSLLAEPMLVRKGARIETGQGGGETTGEVELDYLELPLFVALRFRQSGGLRPYVFGGPTVAANMGSRRRLSEGDAAGRLASISRAVRGGELGLAVGGGVATPVAFTEVFVEGQCGWGLTDVTLDSAQIWEGLRGAPLRTRGFQLRIGLTVGL